MEALIKNKIDRKTIEKKVIQIVARVEGESENILSVYSLFSFGIFPFSKHASRLKTGIRILFGIDITNNFKDLELIKDVVDYIEDKLNET